MSEQENSYIRSTKTDLEEIFLSHEKWLNSNGQEGVRATLRNLDLTKSHLDRISFSLNGQNLSEAIIEKVNFTSSDLESVKLLGQPSKRLSLIVPF